MVTLRDQTWRLLKEPMDTLAAALTPTIALLGIYIAWRQHKTQRERLRLDLYDRRFRVYRALMDFLGIVLGGASVSVDAHRTFRLAIAEAAFLFEADILQYLDEVSKRALRFRELNERLRVNVIPLGVDRATVVNEETEQLKWLSGQVEAATKAFGHYLSFSRL
jgi:hypothetical protein